MGEFVTPGNLSGDRDYRCLQAESEHRRLNLLSKPGNYIEAMATSNVGYQMQYSVDSLERQLAEEGNPHILQLNLDWHDDDWKNPYRWRLYADGRMVASGSGEYAKQCFCQSAEVFRDTCREAITAAALDSLSEHDFTLLKKARAIAAVEPFGNDSTSLGTRLHRVF